MAINKKVTSINVKPKLAISMVSLISKTSDDCTTATDNTQHTLHQQVNPQLCLRVNYSIQHTQQWIIFTYFGNRTEKCDTDRLLVLDPMKHSLKISIKKKMCLKLKKCNYFILLFDVINFGRNVTQKVSNKISPVGTDS